MRHSGAWDRDDRDEQMIDKVAADAGPIGDTLDTDCFEFGARADARAQQNRGRVDRASRERHAARANFLHDPATFDFDANCASTLNDYAMRIAERPDRQVEPMTCRMKIPNRGRNTNAVTTIARPRSYPCGPRIVVVGDLVIALFAASVVKGPVNWLPALSPGTLDPDWTIGAVKIALHVAIVFELAKKGQDLFETPFAIAPCGPFVVILRRAAQRDMTINR
jgi:hypothetical protein